MAGKYDIRVDQAASFWRRFHFRQADGSPLDLTGCTLRMQVRRTPADTAVIVNFEPGSGLTIDAPDGRVEIALEAAQTAALAVQSSYYDLMLTTPSDGTNKVMEGRFVVAASVTR